MKRLDGKPTNWGIAPCHDCGLLIERRSSTHLYCPQCKKEHQKAVSRKKQLKRCAHPDYAAWHAAYERKRKQSLRDQVREEYGDRCSICGKEVGFTGKKNQKGRMWARHHISYDPEIQILVCGSCHMWLHGQRAVYGNHPIKKKYGLALGPYVFARRVIAAYEAADSNLRRQYEEPM